MKSPSHGHANKQWHNWLVCRITDAGLLKHAGKLRGVVYDQGSGEAPYRPWLLEHAERYVAVDGPASMHAARPDVTADLNRPLPIAGAVADTVISLSVLERLCEPESMLREACRILRPGGCLMLQVPSQWAIHEVPHDFSPYTPRGLRHLLGKVGLAEIEIEPQSGFFTMWLLKLNYVSLRLVRAPRWMRLLLRSTLPGRLGRDRAAESAGCFVTARKP